MTETATTLRQHVEREGIISFARFMELALYCPNSGYYEQRRNPIGRAGDFFTSVSVGPLFGQLLAFQFARWLGQSACVDLVEAGAHDGQLASDILGWLQQNQPRLFRELRYHIVEPSHRRQAWQRAKLDIFAGTVQWVDNARELRARSPRGVLFANELFDAFPVHRLSWDTAAGRWIEWGVGWQRDRFTWQRLDRDAGHWAEDLAAAGFELNAELQAVLPDGFNLELCPSAGCWWREAARALGSFEEGWFLTFDYGLRAEEYLVPARAAGTLRAYRSHRVSADVLADPGNQDITAQVNFTALQRAGEAEGLRTQGLWTQAQFLTDIAARRWETAAPAPAEAAQFRTLTHPEHLGRAFRVLVQARP